MARKVIITTAGREFGSGVFWAVVLTFVLVAFGATAFLVGAGLLAAFLFIKRLIVLPMGTLLITVFAGALFLIFKNPVIAYLGFVIPLMMIGNEKGGSS